MNKSAALPRRKSAQMLLLSLMVVYSHPCELCFRLFTAPKLLSHDRTRCSSGLMLSAWYRVGKNPVMKLEEHYLEFLSCRSAS